MNRYVSLPKAAKEAADRGDLLTAIKLTQETMGVDLQDAQHAVHAYVQGARDHFNANSPPADFRFTSSGLPPAALTALNRGNLIEAIKHTRNAKGLGLKEAKDAVENYLSKNSVAKQQFDNATRTSGANLAPLVGVLVLVLVAAAGFATYLFSIK